MGSGQTEGPGSIRGLLEGNLLDERSALCPKELGNCSCDPWRVEAGGGGGKSTTGFSSEGLSVHKWDGGCLGKGAHHVLGQGAQGTAM